MVDISQKYWDYSVAVGEELQAKGVALLEAFFAQDSELITLKENTWHKREQRDLFSFFSQDETRHSREILQSIISYLNEAFSTQMHIRHAHVRKYMKGSFTLQHDKQLPPGWRILFFIGKWDPAFRGEYTIVHPDQQPLLIHPAHNTLAVCRTDEQTRTFVKRVNHYAEDNEFVLIEGVLE